MIETKENADLLDLLMQTLTAQTVSATCAHTLLGLDDACQSHAPCTAPAELSRLASELAASARETASNKAPAYNARVRQMDYVHAQVGGLVQLSERYLAHVRQRRDVVQHQQYVTAVAYTSAEAGMQTESTTNELAASVVALESFILAVRAVAHQSVAVVTGTMAAS